MNCIILHGYKLYTVYNTFSLLTLVKCSLGTVLYLDKDLLRVYFFLTFMFVSIS